MNKYVGQVFSFLMKLVYPSFVFPRGGIAQKSISDCLNALQKKHMTLSRERIVDFCLCQAYAISRFERNYKNKWKVSHSFGEKAIERYFSQTPAQKRYQDRWLKENGLSRNMLVSLFQDRSKHPLYKFIYPEYEEATKSRLPGTLAGFYICQVSTMLWTPLSPTCNKCPFTEKCRKITQHKYFELYRIRTEEFNERGSYGNN